MKRHIAIIITLILSALAVVSVNAQETQAVATVTAWHLNVRTAPFANAERVGIVDRGYTAGVIGKNSDSTWYQIILEGGFGWVNGHYLVITNEHTVPVTFTVTPPVNQPVVAGGLVNTGALNIRPVPSPTGNTPITFVYRDTPLTIFARNTDNSWYKVVTANNIQGWVRSTYVDVTSGNINNVPILTEGSAPPPQPPIQVYATGFINTGALNIRSVPGATNNVPITFVYEGTHVSVIGRNGDSSWLMVSIDGVMGWARSRYITITSGNVANAPILN